jgi:3-hydroxyisobutyrate dehydrogenase-like beta-hydroxyacid dehydrogenase
MRLSQFESFDAMSAHIAAPTPRQAASAHPPAAVLRIALIGYGEAGRIFSAGLAALPAFRVAAHDILLAQAAAHDALSQVAARAGVRLEVDLAAALGDADIVISAVTADAAENVAHQACSLLRPGQAFVDLNSISPEARRRGSALFAARGIAYVEAAVMAPVPPYGLRVPILLGGPDAAALAARMAPAGMAMAVHSTEVGAASAIKMCRSVMIKGLEALAVESMLCARHYGVEDQVIASLDETFPSMDWQRQADYLVARVVQHGRRRAAEMREVAHTVEEAGLQPLMAAAIARRHDWLADQVDAGTVARDEKSWRKVADAIRAAAAAHPG